MLYKDVLMEDIDVAQWRNAQSLLLESAKERPRIVVLHDDGVVRKVAHSEGLPVNSPPAAGNVLFAGCAGPHGRGASDVSDAIPRST